MNPLTIIGIDPSLRRQLSTLRASCVKVADDEKLTGCCAAVALMVKAVCGGVILKGAVNGWQHYWNLLPCGNEIDLTSTQFGGNGWRPLAAGVEAENDPALIPISFLLFARDTLATLEQVNP